ncbi:hypothetical protein CC1G_05905 [Coprinopsis cinerea okayama7|uniref:Uncharacterized protein n=1 Tax=Coprinopsis cinerea (strain Okayama-7 / 130 / ATCC MYA-4618 / FGSC 9003) TaxID=240176 RepID=A8NAF4_COPC7|nr:hypothetical protein CC1G_05905 [Coprinopsis cinerea okayama7\|eukprot:XP_001831806.2 hypothetical protein CC1G_05905 [Coprinopsis cinerea okayama7\
MPRIQRSLKLFIATVVLASILYFVSGVKIRNYIFIDGRACWGEGYGGCPEGWTCAGPGDATKIGVWVHLRFSLENREITT